MLDLPVFPRVGLDDPRNGAVNLFMQTLRDTAGLVALDSSDPADVAAANGGVRAANINAMNRACSELIVARCPGDPIVVEAPPAVLPAFPVPVCVDGDMAEFGRVTGSRPDGVRLTANNECRFAFWAGGFDGVTTTDAGAHQLLRQAAKQRSQNESRIAEPSQVHPIDK